MVFCVPTLSRRPRAALLLVPVVVSVGMQVEGCCVALPLPAGAPARPAPDRPAPYATWRGPAGILAAGAVLRRLDALPGAYQGAALVVDGATLALRVERLARCLFLDNPAVGDGLLAVAAERGAAHPEAFSSDPDNRAWVRANEPTSDLPEHRLAVGLIAALTGVPAPRLSERTPELGLFGTAALGLRIKGLWPRRVGPGDPVLGVIVHDTTDLLRHAGAPGFNEALFRVEGSLGSALMISSAPGDPIHAWLARQGCLE